jgi:hypothetical protein
VGSATTTRTELTPNGVIATLRQFWNLRIESEEVTAINPLRLAFWDPAVGALASASLPAKRIEPLPRNVTALRARLMHEAITAHRHRRISLFAALSVPVLALLVLIGVALYKSLPTRADRRLSRTCTASSTPEACFRAVIRWSRESFGMDGHNTIGHLQQTYRGEAAERLTTLQLALFSASEVPTEPERLTRSLVRAARRRRLHRYIRVCFAWLPKIV